MLDRSTIKVLNKFAFGMFTGVAAGTILSAMSPNVGLDDVLPVVMGATAGFFFAYVEQCRQQGTNPLNFHVRTLNRVGFLIAIDSKCLFYAASKIRELGFGSNAALLIASFLLYMMGNAAELSITRNAPTPQAPMALARRQ